jgi:hypothetical protein
MGVSETQFIQRKALGSCAKYNEPRSINKSEESTTEKAPINATARKENDPPLRSQMQN